MLRRLLSILLFTATVLPSLAPMLLAGSMAASSLPMCCRRGGAHHCADAMAMTQITRGETMARAPQMKCPFQQRSLGAVQFPHALAPRAEQETVGALREPTAMAQAECLWRISFDRSRQKRGPPATRLS